MLPGRPHNKMGIIGAGEVVETTAIKKKLLWYEKENLLCGEGWEWVESKRESHEKEQKK